ncbi:MAG: hypothetical protein RL149_975 [Actinomycetota bacterium]
MVLPLFALFLAAAIFSYVNNRSLEQIILYMAYAAAGLLALFGWLIPVIRHLNFYIELTSSRLIIRDGLFGQKSVEVSLADVSALEIGRGRELTISRRSGEPLVISSIPKSKALVAELRSLGL